MLFIYFKHIFFFISVSFILHILQTWIVFSVQYPIFVIHHFDIFSINRNQTMNFILDYRSSQTWLVFSYNNYSIEWNFVQYHKIDNGKHHRTNYTSPASIDLISIPSESYFTSFMHFSYASERIIKVTIVFFSRHVHFNMNLSFLVNRNE